MWLLSREDCVSSKEVTVNFPISRTYQRFTLQQDCSKQSVVLQIPHTGGSGLWSKWLLCSRFLRKFQKQYKYQVILQIWHKSIRLMPMNYLYYLYSSMKSLIKKRYMVSMSYFCETHVHERRKQTFYIPVYHYMYSEMTIKEETCFFTIIFPACQWTPFTPSSGICIKCR